MNKNIRGLIVIFGVVGGIVLVMLVGQYFAFSQTIGLQVVADPSIEKIELFSLKDDQHILLTIQYGKADKATELILRINEESKSLFDRPVTQYYAFIMTKDGQKFQSDAFNFSSRAAKLRLNIGMAGSWELVNR